jgi:hypothetical protein
VNADAVVRRDLFPRARRCYQRDLANSPDEAGKLIIAISADPNGDVSKASVLSNTALSTRVAGCVLAGAKMLLFAPGKGGTVKVAMTLNLQKQ